MSNLVDGVEFWFTLTAAPPADEWDDDAIDDITTEMSFSSIDPADNNNPTETQDDIDVTNLFPSTDADGENLS